MRVSAIVPAAGFGLRLGAKIKKLYLKLSGKPILFYTLMVFEKAKFIDEIICAVTPSDIDYCHKNVIEKFNFKKVKLVKGGKTRFQSVGNALRDISPESDIVVIHDGARPFLRESLLKKSVETAKRFGGCCVAVPVKNTVKIADKRLDIIESPLRSTLWEAQTPQCFRVSVIKDAYKKAKNNKMFTDDSSVVEAINKKVKIIKGAEDNIKITTKTDLAVAQMIVKNLNIKNQISK